MRFLARAGLGAVLFALTLGLAALGARPFLACAPALSWVGSCAFDAEAGGPRRGGGGGGDRERAFAVAAAPIELETIAPTIAAFGEARAGRALILRAPIAGELSEVSPLARDGALAPAGATLFRMDPADATAAWADARADLAAAEAELAEANAALALARGERDAAERSRALREQALGRQIDLGGRGVSSAAAEETARIALADAERALLSEEQALAAAEAATVVRDLEVQRARIVLEDAERTLAEIDIAAPFAGVLSEVEAAVGRRVGANEALARLVDLSDLELAFRVSAADFARLLDDDGALRPLTAQASLALGDRRVDVAARLVRSGAAAASGDGGRLVFAALQTDGATPIRPGDFLTIEVDEPALEQVARLPARAVDATGRILVIGEDGRAEEVAVEVVRRQGSDVLAVGAPAGALLILERGPQLGPGVRVRAIGAPTGPGGGGADRPGRGDGSGRPRRGDGEGRRPGARGGGGGGEGRGGRRAETN